MQEADENIYETPDVGGGQEADENIYEIPDAGSGGPALAPAGAGGASNPMYGLDPEDEEDEHLYEEVDVLPVPPPDSGGGGGGGVQIAQF